MKKPGKSILRLPLRKRAEMASKEAVEEVIDEHARLGLAAPRSARRQSCEPVGAIPAEVSKREPIR
jgi:hypothetical protein